MERLGHSVESLTSDPAQWVTQSSDVYRQQDTERIISFEIRCSHNRGIDNCQTPAVLQHLIYVVSVEEGVPQKILVVDTSDLHGGLMEEWRVQIEYSK